MWQPHGPEWVKATTLGGKRGGCKATEPREARAVCSLAHALCFACTLPGWPCLPFFRFLMRNQEWLLPITSHGTVHQQTLPHAVHFLHPPQGTHVTQLRVSSSPDTVFLPWYVRTFCEIFFSSLRFLLFQSLHFWPHPLSIPQSR